MSVNKTSQLVGAILSPTDFSRLRKDLFLPFDFFEFDYLYECQANPSTSSLRIQYHLPYFQASSTRPNSILTSLFSISVLE